MSGPESDLLRGTLDLPIPETLTLEPMHGLVGITRRTRRDARHASNPGSTK